VKISIEKKASQRLSTQACKPEEFSDWEDEQAWGD